MSKLKFYQYKKCSSCVKAKKYLDNKGFDYQDIDITEKPPSVKELESMLKYYDGELKKLFNTSGIQYRELDIKSKLPQLSKKEALDLLNKNGKLVKRPFLISDKTGFVGFKEELWQTLK